MFFGMMDINFLFLPVAVSWPQLKTLKSVNEKSGISSFLLIVNGSFFSISVPLFHINFTSLVV